MVYPQNGDSFVTIDSATSLHPMNGCLTAAADVVEEPW